MPARAVVVAVANQTGGVAKDHRRGQPGRGVGGLGAPGAPGRPRPAGQPDLLARSRPRVADDVGPLGAAGAGPGPGCRPRDRRRAGPVARDDRAGRGRAAAADPSRARAAAQGRAGTGPGGVRLHPAGLPTDPGHPDHPGADRGSARSGSAAVRDAQPSRRRPAAGHRLRRAGRDQPAAARGGRAAHALRRAQRARPAGSDADRHGLRGDGVGPAHPAVGAYRAVAASLAASLRPG